MGLMKALRAWAAGIILAIGVTGIAGAQEQAVPSSKAVEVGLFVSPPFVMQGKDGYEGMAVDLWELVAGRLGLVSNYRVYPTVRQLVKATEAGDIDVAVTNLSITRKRAETVDFSHPWYNSGLRVMVDNQGSASFRDLFAALQDAGFLTSYAWLALVILLATIGFTVFDRRFDEGFSRRWRDGLADSFYLVMSVVTSGRYPSRKNLFGWFGRVWQAFWLIFGVAVLAYVTSSVTSVMTTMTLQSQINSLDDLQGRTVGVLDGSVAEDFALANGLEARSYPDLDAIVAALRRNDVAATINDAPVLEYYAYTHPGEPLDVVGALFEPDKYGFAMPLGSKLVKEVTLEVISAHEQDEIDAIREKYFGEPDL